MIPLKLVPDDLVIDPDEVIDSSIRCDGCGACCLHMGTPPGYALFFSLQPDGSVASTTEHAFPGDLEHFAGLPLEAKQELHDYYRAMLNDEIADRTYGDNTPCLWFDGETRQCRHWEHRPSICRDFTVGSIHCIEHRENRGVQPRR